jgi:hypothetical protein
MSAETFLVGRVPHRQIRKRTNCSYPRGLSWVLPVGYTPNLHHQPSPRDERRPKEGKLQSASRSLHISLSPTSFHFIHLFQYPPGTTRPTAKGPPVGASVVFVKKRKKIAAESLCYQKHNQGRIQVFIRHASRYLSWPPFHGPEAFDYGLDFFLGHTLMLGSAKQKISQNTHLFAVGSDSPKSNHRFKSAAVHTEVCVPQNLLLHEWAQWATITLYTSGFLQICPVVQGIIVHIIHNMLQI